MKEPKKMGRPTQEKKAHDIRVRLPDRIYENVKIYSDNHKQTISETVREALDMLTK